MRGSREAPICQPRLCRHGRPSSRPSAPAGAAARFPHPHGVMGRCAGCPFRSPLTQPDGRRRQKPPAGAPPGPSPAYRVVARYPHFVVHPPRASRVGRRVQGRCAATASHNPSAPTAQPPEPRTVPQPVRLPHSDQTSGATAGVRRPPQSVPFFTATTGPDRSRPIHRSRSHHPGWRISPRTRQPRTMPSTTEGGQASSRATSRSHRQRPVSAVRRVLGLPGGQARACRNCRSRPHRRPGRARRQVAAPDHACANQGPPLCSAATRKRCPPACVHVGTHGGELGANGI